MMRKPPKTRRLLILLIGAVGVCLLLAGAFLGQQAMRHRRLQSELKDRIAAINRAGIEHAEPFELQQLVEKATRQGRSLPEVDYVLFFRQWRQIVSLFDELRELLDNPYLVERSSRATADFHTHLQQLKDELSDSLRNPDLPAEWQWKLYNLRGNAAVLLAYSVLYQEQDGRKAAKLLSDALDDYKAAIQKVDQASLSAFDRALPRWNLELIVAVGKFRRLGLSELSPREISQVQEQLETYIPDAPGYSPGVPIETRVEK